MSSSDTVLPCFEANDHYPLYSFFFLVGKLHTHLVGFEHVLTLHPIIILHPIIMGGGSASWAKAHWHASKLFTELNLLTKNSHLSTNVELGLPKVMQ